MSYVYVTALYDFSKHSINHHSSVAKYINLLAYLYNSNVTVILFTEESVACIIRELYPKMQINIIELEQLPIYDMIMNSNATNIHACLGSSSKLLSIVTICKAYFVYCASQENSGHQTYVWLDCGIGYHGCIPYEQLDRGIIKHITERITVTQMCAIAPSEMQDDCDFLSCNRGKIAGGIAIIPAAKAKWFWEQCLNAVRIMLIYDKLCLDEQIWAYVCGKNPTHFSYIYSDYNILYNLEYITVDWNTVIRNMKFCTSHSLHENGSDLTQKLLDSIKFYHINITPDELITMSYNGQILSYYTDKELSKTCSLILQALYSYNKERVLELTPNAVENCLFVGTDITQPIPIYHPIHVYLSSHGYHY